MEIDGVEIPGTVPLGNSNWSTIYVEVLFPDASLDDITAKLYEAPPEDVPTPAQGGISLHQIELSLPTGQHFVSLLFNQPLTEWRNACIAFCRLDGRCWAEVIGDTFQVSDGRIYQLEDCQFSIVTEDLQPHGPSSLVQPLQGSDLYFPTSQALVESAQAVWKRRGASCEELLSIQPPEDPSQETGLTRRVRHLFAILEETFCELKGRPSMKADVDPADSRVLALMERIGDNFQRIVVWEQNGAELYLAFQQEDRRCPLIITAGRIG